MATDQSFDAVVMTVAEEIGTKSNTREFQRCTVEFKTGPLTGKRFWAQRTLGVNAKGTENQPVVVGQRVRVLYSTWTDNEGKVRPSFEISTSIVDSAEDILSLMA